MKLHIIKRTIKKHLVDKNLSHTFVKQNHNNMDKVSLAEAITIIAIFLGVNTDEITGIKIEDGKNCFLYSVWGSSEAFIDLSDVAQPKTKKR